MYTIASPLSTIHKNSICEGSLPTEWKIGNITPIHKKGSKINPGNYRPIILTSVVGKKMDSLVCDHLVNHMTENNLFCDVQHRFVPGQSYLLLIDGDLAVS